MPKLTADQAFQLAQSYHNFARALGDYRFANFSKLTATQRIKIEGFENTIRNASSNFIGLSIKLDLDNLQVTLDQINAASNKMDAAIQKLDNINKVIQIATVVVTLGSAVISGNIPGITASTKELVSFFS